MYRPNINDYFNREGLNIKRKDGLILFDYSKSVQYEYDWDDITVNSRGIVFEESTGKVVARPFRKFWNYEEHSDKYGAKIPKAYHPNYDGECMILDKSDGSCGICYFYNNKWYVNTPGSFQSEQAIWAKEYLDENIKTELMNPNHTYLFEIIYPENRIVVDYGELKTLRLTGIIETQTGNEFWIDYLQQEAKKLGFDVVEHFKFSSLDEMFKARTNLSVNEEGYVITYRNGFKFKLKGEEYCKVHKAACSITPLSFWRATDYITMRVSNEFIEAIPEEFRTTVDTLCETIERLHKDVYERIFTLANTVPSFENSVSGKKERYSWIKENIPTDYVYYVLGMLTSNDNNCTHDKLKKDIHRNVRPTNNKVDYVDSRLERIINLS